MYVVVRADGGPEIGYGHLIRTGALAHELLNHGHDVTYATTSSDQVQEVCPVGVDTVTLPSRTDPEPVCELVRDRADATVVDSYLADGEYQSQIRDASPSVVVADDARHPVAADILVNGNLYASDLDYELVDPPPTCCLGSKYLLLRRAITEYAQMDPPWREVPDRAVITMGGSDVGELTPTVIRAFDGVDLRVDAVIGPGFSSEQETAIDDAAADVDADIRSIRNPDDLPERMFRADFGVTTASTTTYELLSLGTPIITLPVVENQRLIAESLRQRDAATVLDTEANEAAFSTAIAEYIENPSLRQDRRETGRCLVDGRGPARVYQELLSITGSN